jgi:F0F1-type ATP synthase alpha subunit
MKYQQFEDQTSVTLAVLGYVSQTINLAANKTAELEEVKPGNTVLFSSATWVTVSHVFTVCNSAQAGELVEFDTGVQAIVLNLEEDNVGVVLMGPGDGIREGSRYTVLALLPLSK